MAESQKTILVIGATGYVGSRLVPRLLSAGYRVRALSRSLDKLQSRSWAKNNNVQLVEADLLDYQALCAAVAGCYAAYYLVHSMNPQSKDFALTDRQAAQNMIRAAEAMHLPRIIYLGGLGEQSTNLSKHLRSRAEVAQILQSGPSKVTVLRAAMIIGSGSASFEILRYLVERLPIMITPRWVSTPSQPIAIRNVLNYLIGCLEAEETAGHTFDIGGPEVVSYKDLMRCYAEEAGIGKCKIIPVPVFTPRLSSYWIHLVTPVPAYIARPLAEGLRNPAICQDERIRNIIPQELISVRMAIRLALNKMQHHDIESHWTDAGLIAPAEWYSACDPNWAGGTVFGDARSLKLKATPEEIWQKISRLGGDTGWYYGNWLWRLRGLADRLIGGVGLKRGRRHPDQLYPGDCLDFWRIKAVEPAKRLLLLAEMKLPGEALLEFRIRPLNQSTTELVQIARFLPSGLAGIIYWYTVSPLHNIIFNGMLRGIATACGAEIVSGPTKTTTS